MTPQEQRVQAALHGMKTGNVLDPAKVADLTSSLKKAGYDTPAILKMYRNIVGPSAGKSLGNDWMNAPIRGPLDV